MVIGLALVGCALVYRPLSENAYGIVYGGFIMLAFSSNNVKKVLSHPYMIWLGERSYSLFLIHFSVFYLSNYIVSHFTPDRNGMYALFSRMLGIPFAMFMSMLLFHFIERKQARGLLTEKAFWPWQVKKVMAEQGFYEY
jgi:peptidoglycan/LPS O-acetylase OafA/YrhL